MTRNIFNDNISPRNEGNPKRSKSSAMKKLFAYSSLLVLGAGLGIGATYAYSQNPLELALRTSGCRSLVSGYAHQFCRFCGARSGAGGGKN
jgi:hypothetical protein